MIIALCKAIYWFSEVLTSALVLRCLLSWFVRSQESFGGRLYVAVIKFTEPFVQPCRKALSRLNTGMWDFSLLLAMLLIQAIANILVKLLLMIG